ncbi:MAG TPA: hypothetical protein VF584_20130 [Longimicrobium sp.]|jgi:hypothetical protein
MANPVNIVLNRAGEHDASAQPLWAAILLHTEAVSFTHFESFLSGIARDGDTWKGVEDDVTVPSRPEARRHRPIPGAELYGVIRDAAESFLLLQGGVWNSKKTGVPPVLDLSTVRDADGHLLMPRDDEDNHRTPSNPSCAGKLVRALTGTPAETGAETAEAEAEAAERDRASQTVDDDYLRLGGKPMTYAELNRELRTYLRKPSNNYLSSVLSEAYDRGTRPSPLSALTRGAMGPFLLELIWSYWHEEALLTQTMNAILLRFQNIRRPGDTDPLAEMELDPLMPLAGVLWGYLQDEHTRLSVVRRAYEYSHQYDLPLSGRAVPRLRPADPRSRFITAFHHLLRECARFFREDNNTTVMADAFGVMNALRDVHMVLAEGAHNQFRDLPWTARVEMLMQQWILSQPEVGDFLRGRPMAAYREPWMGRVDAMKRLQGWGDTSSVHFADLARSGERILLSIRYGNWTNVVDQEQARAWVRYWRPEIQNYVHAYYTATGVNLTDDVVATRREDERSLPPSYHLARREQALRSRWR